MKFLKNFAKRPPKCYDLILTNCKYNFQNTKVINTGYSDFHKMTVLKTEFVQTKPLQINYRDLTQYNSVNFVQNLGIKFARDQLSYRDFNKFQQILCEILGKRAPLKTKYVRANNSHFMTKQLQKMIYG